MMSISYINTRSWLRNHDFKLLSTIESYTNQQLVKIECNKGHVSTLTLAAYYCRKSRAKVNNKELWLCDQCKPKIDNFGKRKFQNYCYWLLLRKYKVKSTFNDFTENKITFECIHGHTTTVSVKYLGVRKFSKAVQKNPKLLCSQCGHTDGRKTPKILYTSCGIMKTIEPPNLALQYCHICSNHLNSYLWSG